MRHLVIPFVLTLIASFALTSTSHAGKKARKRAAAEQRAIAHANQQAQVKARLTTEPSVGFTTFLSADNKDRTAEAGYSVVGQSADSEGGPSSVTYEKKGASDELIEKVLVKYGADGAVGSIVQTIENKRSGELITNLIDYNEKSTSRCSNLNPTTGKPGASTQCSTLNSTLCARFANQNAREEIMPYHYRAMSAQLSGIRNVKVGQRIRENLLANSEANRCDKLAANLDVERAPAYAKPDDSMVTCQAIGCTSEPITEPEPPAQPDNLWKARGLK
jgi:hypothetical protein